MSGIRQRVAERYLTGGAKRPEDLKREGWRIELRDEGYAILILLFSEKGGELGGLRMRYRNECKSWEVMNSKAPSGFGPLLYDLAMEWAGDKGIIPDRDNVSADARNIWKHYYDKRRDVWKFDLGNEPINCEMHERYEGDLWEKNMEWLDFRFVAKSKKVLPKLKALGLFKYKS